jgi:hypothetical protein
MHYYRSPLAIGLVIVVLVLLGAGLAAWQFVSVKTTGSPLGPAVRTPTHILQLIHTVERYLPRLHRPPGNDRFRIDLLAIPIANPAQQKMFTLLRQQQANAVTPMTKILGAEGDVAWVQALGLFAVNLRTGRIVSEMELRKLNPQLDLFLASARVEFTDRCIAVSPDGSQAYAFTPETFTATAVASPPRRSWMDERFADHLEGSLCSGGLISTNDWIAVVTEKDALNDFKTGFSLPRDFTAGEKDHARQLYRGQVDTNTSRPRITSSEHLSPTEYRAANFLRAKPGGAILRAGNPQSLFLLHRLGTGLFASFTLTRISLDGQVLWAADTGLGRLQQVLPGTDSIVLIGERPPVPNQVSEPILVVISVSTGNTQTISLWH